MIKTYAGCIWRDGQRWIVKDLGVMTQGTSFDDALYMLDDAVKMLNEGEPFTLHINRVDEGKLELSSDNLAAIETFYQNRRAQGC